MAPVELPVPVISKVTSPETSGALDPPSGITSKQASSLHSNGAVNTFVLVIVQAPAADNTAVKATSLPSAGSVIPVNV